MTDTCINFLQWPKHLHTNTVITFMTGDELFYQSGWVHNAATRIQRWYRRKKTKQKQDHSFEMEKNNQISSSSSSQELMSTWQQDPIIQLLCIEDENEDQGSLDNISSSSIYYSMKTPECREEEEQEKGNQNMKTGKLRFLV